MPKLYNKHHGDAPADAVYIGRPTIFGNPFTHDMIAAVKSELIPVATREAAVQQYRDWFQMRMTDPDYEAAVLSLRGKDLVCWCAPKACHGEVLLEYLEGLDASTDSPDP